MVQTPHPPTNTDRYSRAEESEVCEGKQVTKPTPPPPARADRDSGAAVSGVGVTRGKRTDQAELGQTDSRERRKMRCRLAVGKGIFMRPCHRGAHSEDLPSSAYIEALLIERSL